MKKDQAINQLRLRLLLLIIGLILSYIISFGLAIYFVLSNNYFKDDNSLLIISIGIILLFMSFLHIRFQYRKYSLYLMRAQNLEE